MSIVSRGLDLLIAALKRIAGTLGLRKRARDGPVRLDSA